MLKKLFLIWVICLLDITNTYAAASNGMSSLPFKHETTDIGSQLYKTIVVFLLVILLAYVVIFLIKKYYLQRQISKQTDASHIKILSRKYLARNLSIIMLQINNKQYSLAQTHNELILLEKETLAENNGKNDQSETPAG